DFVSDIQEAIRRIEDYTAGVTYEGFLADTKTQDAVIRNLEIIGEATKNLSEELRTKRPNIPWKSMAGVRDKLIHHYFGVNLDIVWQVATAELPQVIAQLARILDEENPP
ncbi:MAG: HepT-like ribonuclease domain-containing protein, partial [Blastocatellia bacterium]